MDRVVEPSNFARGCLGVWGGKGGHLDFHFDRDFAKPDAIAVHESFFEDFLAVDLEAVGAAEIPGT